MACKKDEPKNKDELINSNLLKTGTADPALLVGEWELVKFAYTADGKKISGIVDISNVAVGFTTLNYIDITIPDEKYVLSLCDIEPKLSAYDLSSIWNIGLCDRSYFYSISENLISFITSKNLSYFYINIILTNDGNNVLNALKNTYSFVVKDNELIIYFTEVEDKNLLILKKR